MTERSLTSHWRRNQPGQSGPGISDRYHQGAAVAERSGAPAGQGAAGRDCKWGGVASVQRATKDVLKEVTSPGLVLARVVPMIDRRRQYLRTYGRAH